MVVITSVKVSAVRELELRLSGRRLVTWSGIRHLVNIGTAWHGDEINSTSWPQGTSQNVHTSDRLTSVTAATNYLRFGARIRLGRPLGQCVFRLTSAHEWGENRSERQVDMVLCAGAAARGAERGLNFIVWNFAWDRLASRLYSATATTFLMKMSFPPLSYQVQIITDIDRDMESIYSSFNWLYTAITSLPTMTMFISSANMYFQASLWHWWSAELLSYWWAGVKVLPLHAIMHTDDTALSVTRTLPLHAIMHTDDTTLSLTRTLPLHAIMHTDDMALSLTRTLPLHTIMHTDDTTLSLTRTLPLHAIMHTDDMALSGTRTLPLHAIMHTDDMAFSLTRTLPLHTIMHTDDMTWHCQWSERCHSIQSCILITWHCQWPERCHSIQSCILMTWHCHWPERCHSMQSCILMTWHSQWPERCHSMQSCILMARHCHWPERCHSMHTDDMALSLTRMLPLHAIMHTDDTTLSLTRTLPLHAIMHTDDIDQNVATPCKLMTWHCH